MNKRKQVGKISIRKDAEQLLKSGKSRQETFEELSRSNKYKSEVAEVLKSLPSQNARVKYGKWNYALLVILILIAIIYFLLAPLAGILIWYGLLIFAVLKMRTQYYLWVTILTALGLLSGVFVSFLMEDYFIDPTGLLILFLLNIPALILPIWLVNKLTPGPVESKEKYYDSGGRQKFRIRYSFPE